MKPSYKYIFTTVGVLAVTAVAVVAGVVYSGVYNFAADDPHTPVVYRLLETARERSIKVRADTIKPPDLSDMQRIVQGAGNYQAMCAQCHLAPGINSSELSTGLYPSPPNLTREKFDPSHVFWVVKHGIKASGMPAWGKGMSDEFIWNLAAFVQQLPQLDEQGYQNMVASSGGHSHGGGESHSGGDESKHHSHADGDHHDHHEHKELNHEMPHAAGIDIDKGKK
jgi:mono/diheme cytochrome c family protein